MHLKCNETTEKNKKKNKKKVKYPEGAKCTQIKEEGRKKIK